MGEKKRTKEQLINELTKTTQRIRELEKIQTDCKKTKKVSAHKQYLNERLMDSLPHFVMLIRKDRTVLAANRMAREVGAKVGGYCWRDFGHSEFIPEQDKQYINDHKKVPPGGTCCTFCFADEAMKKQKPVHNPEIMAWGKIWDTHWIPLDKDLYLHYAIDISKRKKEEEVLRISEQKFKDLTESTTDWIWEVDKNGVYTYTSPKVKDLLGYEAIELLGKTPFDLMPKEEAERVGKIFKKKLNNKKPFYKLENINLHKDGHLIVLETSGIPIFDEKGQLKGYRGIDRDITELKRAQDTLRFSTYLRSAREEERKGIAREIHDQLGQVLTALKIDLSWFEKKLPQDQKYLTTKTKAMSHIIDDTIKAMKRIIAELRPTLLDDFGLVAAIESMVEEWQKRTGIQCKLKIKLNSTEIDKDRSIDIFRIVQEALTNVSRHAQATQVTLSLQKQADNILLLEVRDNGKGISKMDISRIQSFGLLGIRERSEYWNGTFSIKGDLRMGTVLAVQIPLKLYTIYEE